MNQHLDLILQLLAGSLWRLKIYQKGWNQIVEITATLKTACEAVTLGITHNL